MRNFLEAIKTDHSLETTIHRTSWSGVSVSIYKPIKKPLKTKPHKMDRSIIFQLFVLFLICFITENTKAQESNTEHDSLRKDAVRLFIY